MFECYPLGRARHMDGRGCVESPFFWEKPFWRKSRLNFELKLSRHTREELEEGHSQQRKQAVQRHWGWEELGGLANGGRAGGLGVVAEQRVALAGEELERRTGFR